MDAFARMREQEFGELHFRRDAESGLRAVVAIHDTRLGPALGGCRFVRYGEVDEAVVDALRLARGMTYKAALAGIPHGGGKAVILKPEGEFERAELFDAFGRFVDDLAGRYITAEDSGTGTEDMDVVRRVTRYAVGTDPALGGGGDPSPFTAMGVRCGMQAALDICLGTPSLEGVHVAVQGVGQVGFELCQQLHALGARLTVADLDPTKVTRAVREWDAQAASLVGIEAVECDVFAPCALGNAINDRSVAALRCRVVAGAANNQLAEPRHGEALAKRGIVYAPDYAINAGGLICVAQEWAGYDPHSVTQRTEAIYDTVHAILKRAAQEGCTPERVADEMVVERLAAASPARSPE